MAKILVRRTAKTVELAYFNPAHPNLVFSVDRIDWMAHRLGLAVIGNHQPESERASE